MEEEKKPLLQYKNDFILELKSSNYSLETIYNYGRDLNLFELFLVKYNLTFDQIDKRAITLYKGFLREREYANTPKDVAITELNQSKPAKGHRSFVLEDGVLNSRSVNRVLSTLRSYIKFLTDFDYSYPIPSDAIKLIKMEKKEAQVAQLDELIKLIEFPSEFESKDFLKIRNRAVLEILFATGMRISELVRLNRDQLNDEGKIYIKGKGKKQRFVYLTPRAMFYLGEWLKLRKDNLPALFIPFRGGRNGKRGERISINYLQEKISEYRKRLGIIVPTSAHSLRHGFATYLAEEGASPAAIQILLGHESLHTTNRYVHASDKYAEESHKQYHPLPQV